MTGEVAKEFEAAVLFDFIHFNDGGKKKLFVFRFLVNPLLLVSELVPTAFGATPSPLPTVLLSLETTPPLEVNSSSSSTDF